MSLDVDVALENTRSPMARAALAAVARGTLRAEGVRNALVSIALVDRRTIARLNREHLGHRGPTDVLSFGFTHGAPVDLTVGDIYICPDVARENARARGERIRDEVARLVIHGVLHVLGYDHPDETRETSEMWRRQERLLRRLRAARAAGGVQR